MKEKSELEKNNGPKEIDVEQLFKDVDDIYEYNGYFNYWRYEGSLTYPPCDGNVFILFIIILLSLNLLILFLLYLKKN